MRIFIANKRVRIQGGSERDYVHLHNALVGNATCEVRSEHPWFKSLTECAERNIMLASKQKHKFF